MAHDAKAREYPSLSFISDEARHGCFPIMGESRKYMEGFPKIRGTFLGGPNNKDDRI